MWTAMNEINIEAWNMTIGINQVNCCLSCDISVNGGQYPENCNRKYMRHETPTSVLHLKGFCKLRYLHTFSISVKKWVRRTFLQQKIFSKLFSGETSCKDAMDIPNLQIYKLNVPKHHGSKTLMLKAHDYFLLFPRTDKWMHDMVSYCIFPYKND